MHLFIERYFINCPINVGSKSFEVALQKIIMNFDIYLKQEMCNTSLSMTLLLQEIDTLGQPAIRNSESWDSLS